MTIDQLRTYKRILLLGYAVEGQASERFIKKYHPTAEIGIADQKDDPHYLDKQKDYDLAIRTPLLRPENVTIPYTTGTNLFFANMPQRIIGVTGTKGKSTTVSLLHHVLINAGISSKLCGNIGKPMLDIFLEGFHDDDVFVLELSSYQLEDIHYSPEVACFLNIYPELHNHPDYESYFEAKTHITTFQDETGQFFYNGKIPEIAQLSHITHAQSHDFTHIDIHIPDNLSFDTHPDNIKAVYAIAQSLGAEDGFSESLKSFQPLPHRMHNIGVYSDITFYDDSASTHPQATIHALDIIHNVGTVIIGGQDRGYDFQPLVERMSKKHVDTVILFPETQKKIYNEIKSLERYNPRVIQVETMKEAVDIAFSYTQKGTACLLSPGAPSYVMYKNFNERGDDFVACVTHYAKNQTQTQHTSPDKSEDSHSTAS